MHPFSFVEHSTNTAHSEPAQNLSQNSPQPFDNQPDRLPWQTGNAAENDLETALQTPPSYTLGTRVPSESQAEETDPRLLAMERNEPKRRLIRDARALCKIRKITQQQMADEIGVPCRTLHEWLQFRRYPKAPGTTLIRRWVEERGDNNYYTS